MASVMALISKAVFEAQAKAAKLGDRLGIDRYVSANKGLEPLGEKDALFLVTVRPGERLWLCAILEAPRFEETMWRAAPSTTPLRDVTDLVPKLELASGSGIRAPAGKLGMSLQTPRTLADADAALLRGGAAAERPAPKPAKQPAPAKPAPPPPVRPAPPPPVRPVKDAKTKPTKATKAAYDKAALLLLSALKAAPPELHPSAPFHGGGPRPQIDAAAYVAAALWLADRVAPMVEARDRTEFDEWMHLARRQVELGPDDTSQRTQLFQARAGAASRVPLKLAIWAAHEAANWSFRPIYAGGAARPAAGQLAKHLLKKGTPEEVRAYLAELDALCVHLELLTKMRERKVEPSKPIQRTLWRGFADDKPSHWLMRLTDGKHALFSKVGTRWALVEGKRDDVLANVGDRHFEAAVRASAE